MTVAPLGLSLDDLYTRAKVKKGTMGAELVRRVWYGLFAHRIDLLAHYERFYSAEYKSFGDFLYSKHGFDDALIRRVYELLSQTRTLGVCDGSLGGGYGFIEWLQKSDGWFMLERLADAQRMIEDEDSE
ncbi:MAG TPA: hypothetical protein VD997_05640 [Phycisphaerales bacterium]|nr:hypothetical protein [Phycisphaerales bacterium]